MSNPRPTHDRPAESFLHAAHAVFVAEQGGGPEAALQRQRGRDPAALAVLTLARGAVSPLSTDDAGAAIVATAAVADYIATLAPLSAGARLMAAGLRVDLTGRQQATLPARQVPANAPLNFVREGAPIPVRRAPVAPLVLGPQGKLAAIVTMSAELARSAAGEATFRQMLAEDAALSMDAALFGATPADEYGPGGLLAGLDPLPGAPGGGEAAVLADLGAVAADVLAAGGVSVVFVADAASAFRANLVLANRGLTVWPSAALAPGTLVGVDPNAFASSVDPAPRFETSDQAVLHMEDTSAAQIGSGAGVASPSISLWQTDNLALKLTLRAAWGMRAPAVAFATGLTW